MSEKNNSWFHCGRCGTLFQSVAGDVEERLCTSCGRNPSLGIEDSAEETKEAKKSPAPLAYLEPEEKKSERERIKQRRKKPNYLVVKLVAVWLVVVIGIVFGARMLWPDKDSDESTASSGAAGATPVSAQDTALLEKSAPLWNRTFLGFLSAATPEERTEFVLAPIDTAARMTKFDALNPPATMEPSAISLEVSEVVKLPGGKNTIETQWTAADGRLFDAVFAEEKQEWRLDWEHFVRYSDLPWALFLAGSGENRGEFRLLARERLANERKGSDTISTILYAPRFGFSNQTGAASPEFLVKRESKDGKLLAAAFEMQKNGKRPFGSTLKNINPDDMIRLRVKVKRIDENGSRRFEIEEIIACHWYSNDSSGVDESGQESEN